MDGFEAPVTVMRSLSEQGAAVAERLRTLDPAAPMRALTAAIPGGAVQAAGARAGGEWDATLSVLSDGVGGHARTIGDNATAYAEVEDRIAQAMRRTA